MISEVTLAHSLFGFWSKILPLLTPSMVQLMNEGFKKELIDERGLPMKPVETKAGARDPALIALFAFFFAKLAIERRIDVREAFRSGEIRRLAQRYAFNAIEMYEPGRTGGKTSLITSQLEEGNQLAENYQRFFDQGSVVGSIEFAPEIPGAGFVASCRADISIGTALFEVKTIKRNLASKDIRQLIVYLALQAATGQRRWTTAGFFNPRRGLYHMFVVDTLIPRMSGGRSAAEVFHDVVDFACTRDIQLDAAF